MFINFESVEKILCGAKFFLGPANDLSRNLLDSLPKEQKRNFVAYIDSKKEGSDITRPDNLEKENVIILTSPLYWKEIAAGLKSEHIYLNTVNGLINVNDYTRLVDDKKYFDFVIDVRGSRLHEEALKVAEKVRGKFHSVAIISEYGNDDLGFYRLGENENSENVHCYIAVTLNGYNRIESEKSISVLYSGHIFEKQSLFLNNDILNVLHFSNGKPCRETVSAGDNLKITYNSLSSEQTSEIIARDVILLTQGKACYYKDFKTSKKYCIENDYISPNKYHHYDDREETDGWQLEVYLFALGLMVKNGFKTVADIGCGSGYKLVNYLKDYDTVGVELAENVLFLKDKYPEQKWLESDFSLKTEIDADVIIFSDVIEHLVDPDLALNYIKNQHFKYLIISTPAREFVYKASELWSYGPPRNPAHQREWTMDEFRAYIEKYFIVLDQRLTNYKQATQMVICKKFDS